ncbi:MAG: aspartate carbamoyltransferase [Lachnospirales bacterium]
MSKDFLSMKNIPEQEINSILNTANTMKALLKNDKKRVPHLSGKTIIMIFIQEDGPAKLSFQLASQYLMSNIADLTSAQTNSTDFYNINELGHFIEQMGGDFIVMNHPMSGSCNLLAQNVRASVINAGDGMNENPTQALLDLMCIKKYKGGFNNLKVSVVGDILNNSVAKSSIWALNTLGAKITLCGPPTLVPRIYENLGVKITYDPYEAVDGADVIMSQSLREKEFYQQLLPSQNEYKKTYKIDEKMLAYAHSDAIVVHNGQLKRGIEVSSKVIVANHTFSEDQISNGVALKMALLFLLANKGGTIG